MFSLSRVRRAGKVSGMRTGISTPNDESRIPKKRVQVMNDELVIRDQGSRIRDQVIRGLTLACLITF
jgi:hypothetical protein